MSAIKISGSKGAYSFDPEISFLREGKFSTVYCGTDDLNRSVLIKKLHSLNDASEYSNHFSHPAFVGYTDMCDVNDVRFLIRPFIEGESFFALSKSAVIRKKSNRELLIKSIQNLGEAFHELHSSGMIHGDIRPHNILLKYDEHTKQLSPEVKIIDLAMMRKSGEVPAQRGFALIYSPPELVLQQYRLIGPSSDQYSLAISMYEILSGSLPFKHFNPELLTHLMLVQPLKDVQGISKATLEILRKGSARYVFKSPPTNLNDDDLVNHLQEGINNRFSSIIEFTDALVSSLAREKKSFFSFFNS